MRRPRRASIPQRQRVFLGCEGESETGYAALLSNILEANDRGVFLDNPPLGGGDPLAIVQAALGKITDREEKRGDYFVKAVLLDSDRLGLAPSRDDEARRLVQANGLIAMWQRPCHEAMLLRHLPRCETLRPPTPAKAMDQLRRRWPKYQKPMSAARLETRISELSVRQAASVEPDLFTFLEAIAF